mgnify:FL=1
MGVCYIVGAGECFVLDINKKTDDIIIAADGGYKYLLDANIEPDFIIGDFDSLGRIPDRSNVIKLNPVKDETDMNAAVEIGIEKGFTEFHVYGACGGRIDHTLANIQLTASLAVRNMKAFIHDGETIITAVCNGSIKFTKDYKGYISVFSHTEKCTGVTLKGLKYTLDNDTLSNIFPLGVSNEFIGYESEIAVTEGTAIVIYGEVVF